MCNHRNCATRMYEPSATNSDGGKKTTKQQTCTLNYLTSPFGGRGKCHSHGKNYAKNDGAEHFISARNKDKSTYTTAMLSKVRKINVIFAKTNRHRKKIAWAFEH